MKLVRPHPTQETRRVHHANSETDAVTTHWLEQPQIPGPRAASCCPARHKPENPREDYGADDRDDDGVNHAAVPGKAQTAHNEPADQRSHDSKHDVQEETVARSFHDFSCCP